MTTTSLRATVAQRAFKNLSTLPRPAENSVRTSPHNLTETPHD